MHRKQVAASIFLVYFNIVQNACILNNNAITITAACQSRIVDVSLYQRESVCSSLFPTKDYSWKGM
ncbi:hypothetical protein GYH30_032623 [Glycine max]|nr:hypothetical protein GYH30_032623 [Glycine max]